MTVLDFLGLIAFLAAFGAVAVFMVRRFKSER